MADRELEYRGHKLVARAYGNGWQIDIHPVFPSTMFRQTMTFASLSDALDEAKKIINAAR